MDELRATVRRAYEWARIRRALPWAAPGLLFGGLGLLTSGLPVLPLGVVLTLSLVVIHWLGNGWDEGLRLGLSVGGASFFAVSAWMLTNGVCGVGCEAFCLTIGAAAGLSLARVAWRGHARSATAATWIATWLAGLACLPLGWSGLVMVLVLVGLTSPIIVSASLRRA